MPGIQTPPASLCDDFGEVKRQRDAFAFIEAKYKRLHGELAAYYADADPELEYEASGERYTVQIGPRANQRSISAKGMRRLFRVIGQSKFLEWCTFRVTDLDHLISDNSGIIETERTGPRTIKAVAIEAAAPAKKAA